MKDMQQFLMYYFIFLAIMFVLSIAIFWKLFEKARQPGWAALVPVYNTVIMLRIVGRPDWWIVLAFIPCVNFIFIIYIAFVFPFEFARAYGKDVGMGLLCLFLGIIGYAVLAFGDAEYVGPVVGDKARSRSKRSLSRFDDEDDEDEDDRRRSRSRAGDEDEDDRPRKRRAVDDDDEDDRPRKRRGDDDDDDRPRRR